MVLVAIFLACGDASETKNETSGGDAGSCDNAVALEDPSDSAGQVVFSVSSDVDPCSVGGFVVGFEGQLNVEPTTTDGTYVINNVPEGDQDVIFTAGSLEVGLADSSDRAVRQTLTMLNGVKNDLKSIDIPKAGSISGVVKLSGQSSHSGIDVFIPGTSFTAKTDADGKFSLTGAPVGTHNLEFNSDGYYKGYAEEKI